MIMPPLSSSSSSSANQAIIMAENPNPNNNNNNNNLQPLQCPRCNSSNTKFCYYNNYSLSQPRHFCKACKRYWTRGGTLRNVPVGGGCRKNKRIKRPPPPSSSSSAAANPKTDLHSHQPTPNHHNSNNNNNPLFYGLNPLEPINFPFSSFSSARVCDNNNNNNNNNNSGAGFDFQPQINGLGLGFSSGLMMTNEASGSFYGSLLASSFQSQKLGSGLVPYEEMQMGKDDVVKEEGEQNRLGWSPGPNPNTNPTEQIHYPDPSSFNWNMGATSIGSWFDPSNSNMGSSVPSLI